MKNLKAYGIYSLVLALLLGLGAVLSLTSANVEKSRPNGYEFSVDTIAQSATGTFEIDQLIKNKTGLFYQITATVSSGTADAMAILQYSAWDTESRWVNIDTATISAAGNYYLEAVTRAKRARLYIVADTTTQSVIYNVAATTTEEF